MNLMLLHSLSLSLSPLHQNYGVTFFFFFKEQMLCLFETENQDLGLAGPFSPHLTREQGKQHQSLGGR